MVSGLTFSEGFAVDEGDIERAAMVEAMERFDEAYQAFCSLDDAVERLEVILGELVKRRSEAERNVKIRRVILDALGDESGTNQYIHELTEALVSPVDPSVTADDVLKLVAPGAAGKRRLTGESLLMAIARGIVEKKSPMNFSQMIEYLDESGIERPGANYRNNLISMVTKAPHIFQRAGRGVYSVTPEATEKVLSPEENEEGLPF